MSKMPDREDVGRLPRPVSRQSDPLVDLRTRDLLRCFPEAFVEGKVDFERLRAALGDIVDDGLERYTFTWAGRRDALRLLQMPTRATLAPCPEESMDWDTTQNVFIEGENLEALKLMLRPYYGRVKMIYIDPPYNTGNDFVYRDDYRDPLGAYLQMTGQRDEAGNLLTSNPETSGRYHSAWLTMMYPRLFLARQLLCEDGVIFVSIDDHEVHNLRMIMNEVFGEENFVGVMKRRAARKTAFLRNTMSDLCDYVLVYSRTPITYPLSVSTVSDATRPVLQENNPECVRVLPAGRPACCGDGTYPAGVYGVRTQRFELLDDLEITDGALANDVRVKGRFRVNQQLLGATVYITRNFGLRRKLLPEEYDIPKTVSDLIDDPEVYNEKGSEELRELFGACIFDNPKPVGLLKYLLRAMSVADQDFLILDFFAGSCTTAQAVLELDREDGGNRRFIMVQLPEPTPEGSAAREAGFETIAEIGKERIRRVIARLKEQNQGQLDLPDRDRPEDLGFRVYKLAPSNYRSWSGVEAEGEEPPPPETYLDQMELFTDALVDGWTPEGVIAEVALKEAGFGLNYRTETVDGLQGQTVYRVTDPDREQVFYLTLDEKVRLEALKALGLDRDTLFVCRASALDDETAANLALQCRLRVI